MWILLLYMITVPLLVYLTVASLYLLFLAIVYFWVHEHKSGEDSNLNRFAILVPAHDEEVLIGGLCDSLLEIKYPENLYKIFIIADNCSDRTAEICRSYPVQVLIRDDPSHIGKGYAISWALKKILLEEFDAVFMVDADNTVDTMILGELNHLINFGEQAIQCYNTVGNRSDSWFTQILFVSRTINNLLYQHAKYKLRLSSFLTGNGMCFRTALLKKRGWTAFTVGEDWEYYAQLIKDGIKVAFAVNARVYHQESRSLEQATSQRLRWSSGRFSILRTLGMGLFLKGFRNKDWFTLDASFPLIFPNYSLLINLTVLTLILCLLIPGSLLKSILIGLSLGLIFCQFMLFMAGLYLAGDYWKVVKAIIYVPLFLVWKLTIDFLSITGIYRADKWGRAKRHMPSRDIDKRPH